ncbi:mannose-6-phosphate isomerase, class I [Streptomyces sp. NPDC050504]|uniref:mannose-6-phosphate isomerase, class I n=1 Tax=Streptomyces sp. NPDC050504 TaxID=3365618 RepID=UPI0037A93D25
MDRLVNVVRPYAWGSTTALPELLGVAPTGEPQAEMWLGAHPGAPSRTPRGPLDEVIAAAPEGELGAATVGRFGPRLPFLLKLLAAGAPLSLQVHPDLARARQGYADEERRGVPLDAAERNYKDANHKPELICALTPFEGLCGFREPRGTALLLESLGVDALKPYVDLLRAGPVEAALRETLTAVLGADRASTDETVSAVAAACARLAGDATAAGEVRAACAAYASIARHCPGDPGVLAAMLLDHVRLEPGEALFLGAGVPHAYLSGLGVEIMANSDNVLRCGLTPKHVDVPELLRVVRFEATGPGVLRPARAVGGEEVYATPVDEFRLSRFVRAKGAGSRSAHDLTTATAQILLCTGGELYADADGGAERLAPGQAVFVPAGERIAVSGAGTFFQATVAAVETEFAVGS